MIPCVLIFLQDIIIVTDQIRNDIHQTETDSEESVSLTDSVTPDDIDIVPEDRPPHCYGLQDTDRPEILDENIMLVNPDNYITIGSDSPTGTRNGHLESESKYQDPNKEWIYVQTEVIATNNGVESKAVAQNGDFSMETVDDDDNEPEVGDYVHSDLVSNLDIPQIKTNNLTEIAEASENAESKMSIVDKKHNPSKLPAYLSDANFVGNGNVSNNAITELTEKEKTPEKSVDSYVHIATDIRNSDTKEGQEESLVKTEGVSDCVTETLLREPTSVEIEHMVPTCTQKHKEDEFDPFYVAENLTKVQGIRSSDRLVCNFTEQCSGYMEQDCKEIMKQTSTDISMIHRIDDSPYVDNIELMKIAMSKHLSGITVTFDCSCMANASIEVVKSTSTNLGNSLYNAHTALTGISNSNLSSGIENSYDASPKINQTSYRSESTDAANASSYVQHEIVDKIANKLLDEASGSTGSSYVTWGKVGQSVDRGVNTQDICPPYVVLNSDFGLTQAKPRELTADTAVETDSFKNEVIFDLPKPSMELHQTASIIKDSVPLGTLSQLILNKLEISRMGNSRTVRDGEKSICNNATVEGPKNADDSSSKEHETINVSESDRHATFGINDEGKYVAKVNDVDGGSKMNSYTKVCLAEIREEVSYQTDKNLV